MEYTVPNLEYAVSVFYNNEQNERIQAHQWLTTAQRCPEAWSFVWELLQPTKGTEVQFFAATTLHTKLLRCWNEVPLESHEELKDKILQAVLGYANGPKIVLNRLCISLAAFILQSGTEDLAAILRPLSSAENMSLLLEVLTVIPEEFNSMTMGSLLRSRNRASLHQACPAVLDDMLRCIQTVCRGSAPDEATIQSWLACAQCASSWLALDGEDDARGAGAAAKHSLTDRLPLCHALLNVVHVLYNYHEVISDSALEACEAALGAVRAAGASPDAINYSNVALQLITELAALSQPILARDNVPNSINEELLGALATCAVALGERHSRAIVLAVQRSEHAGARAFLELLLASQTAPGHYPLHETRSQLVQGLWYTLQDEILCLSEGSDPVSPTWHQLFSRLLTGLVVKAEAPAEEALSKDDAELLRCYRQDVADTVMYCFGVLKDECWPIVEASWRLAATEARREAALHVFLALGDTSPQQKAPEHLITMLQHAIATAAASNDNRLLNTALECLGAYSYWLSSMEQHGAALALQAIRAAGAALPRAPPAAALALKKLAAECSALAAPLAGEIALAAQSETALDSPWARRQLLGAAGAALCAAPLAAAVPPLRALAEQLRKEIAEEGENPSKKHSGAEAAAALMTSLAAQTDLAAELFRSILPALTPYQRHPLLVPPLFLVLKQAVSALMDDCQPMLAHIEALTREAMNTCPCPAGLDLVKLISILFWCSHPGCPLLLHDTALAAARACAVDASGRSDLTEALFVSLQAITKKRPQYLAALDDMLPQLVELGCSCIRLWEAGASRAACGWLAVLATERPAALRDAAPGLTAAALRCIGGALPRNQVEPLAELLLALNRAAWPSDGLAAWLRASLAPDGFPTPHATDEHKRKFIANVIKEKTSKRRLLETVQEFSLACRGLIGTEYARQTLATKQLVS